MPTTSRSSAPVRNEEPCSGCQQNHSERTYVCTIVYTEYDCGQLSQTVRVPRSWKCQAQEAGPWQILKDIISSLIISTGVVFLSGQVFLFLVSNALTIFTSVDACMAMLEWYPDVVFWSIVLLWLGKVIFNQWHGLMGFCRALVKVILWVGMPIFSTIIALLILSKDVLHWLLNFVDEYGGLMDSCRALAKGILWLGMVVFNALLVLLNLPEDLTDWLLEITGDYGADSQFGSRQSASQHIRRNSFCSDCEGIDRGLCRPSWRERSSGGISDSDCDETELRLYRPSWRKNSAGGMSDSDCDETELRLCHSSPWSSDGDGIRPDSDSEEIESRLCPSSDLTSNSDHLCQYCKMNRRGDEWARLQRLARDWKE